MSFSKSDTFDVFPLGFGRGRGFHSTPAPFSLGNHGAGDKSGYDDDTVHSPFKCGSVETPQAQPLDGLNLPQCTDTSVPCPPFDDGRLAAQMSTIVQQIGQQVADSIMSHLATSSPTPKMHTDTDNVKTRDKKHFTPNRTLDLSQVQLVTQREVKDPPAFRGESSDVLTVDEWEESMRTFIRKSGIQLENQAEEILIHLRGRAKDVVRVGIRNSEIDVQHNPQAIYGLLRKHFGSSHCSTVPLADFYSTTPKDQEDPYEYWLRLNRAADVVASCLKEQGKVFDNPTVEVTRMFIKHCPSRDLALTFRSKTTDKWSAREVQEVLDEYHLEKCVKSPKGVGNRININAAEFNPSTAPGSDTPEQKKTSQDNATLERLISMLEKVLLQGQARASRNPNNNNRAPRIEGLTDTPCTVCKDSSHTALTHCKENRLCFLCHLPGHSRRTCPEERRPPPHVHQGN